jgi:hypothetical protein
VITWGFVATRDRRNWRGKLRAYRSVFAEWPEIRRLRREVQRRRVVSDRRLLEQTTGRLDFAQTGEGRAARWAEAVFNPLFDVWRWVMFKVVRW